MGSTTTIFNENPIGLTTLPDGKRLKDAIEEDPAHWLGSEHVAKYGSDTKLLVKLLDARQRLPIHLHPDHSFAAHHLQRHHGKAEAWLIIDGGVVYLGFNRDVEATELARWVEDQNIDSMLGAMHEISVAAGDSVYVPPGLPHAIGRGVFIVEVQEPEDLSILLEWRGFAVDGMNEGHLGLGFETALQATDRSSYSEARVSELIVRQGRGASTLAPGSERYFRPQSYTSTENIILEPGFSIVVVTSGQGAASLSDGTIMPLSTGDTLLVAHGDGPLEISGDLSFIRCQPPQ